MRAIKYKLSRLFLALFIVFICLIGISALCTSLVYASAGVEKNEDSLQETFANTFIAVAFSNMRWSDYFVSAEKEDFFEPLKKAINYIVERKNYKSHMNYYPWFYEYVYRKNGKPKHNVINKWAGPISIGIGWPRYAPAYAHLPSPSIEDSRAVSANAGKFFPLISATLSEILPSISDATGLSLEYYDVDDPRETTSAYARIRIIPLELWPRRGATLFKPNQWNPAYHEIELSEAVSFDASIESRATRMDGYFLPDENNNISLSICKISMKLDEKSFRAAIQECVVRSMGLPALAPSSSKTILDGVIDPKFQKAGAYISDFDLDLIKMLYCKKISPGMTKNEALKVVRNSSHCI